MKRIAVVVVVVVLALAGCSAKADYEKVCNAERLSNAASEPDDARRAMKMAGSIEDNVHSREVLKTLSSLSSVNPDDKGKLFKQAAHEAGYDGPCPIVDMHSPQ